MSALLRLKKRLPERIDQPDDTNLSCHPRGPLYVDLRRLQGKWEGLASCWAPQKSGRLESVGATLWRLRPELVEGRSRKVRLAAHTLPFGSKCGTPSLRQCHENKVYPAICCATRRGLPSSVALAKEEEHALLLACNMNFRNTQSQRHYLDLVKACLF